MLQSTPADSAFFKSTLQLETASEGFMAQSGQNALWTDSWIMMATVAICLLSAVLALRKTVNITPSVIACIFRWKENVNLEYSLKLRRDRDLISILCFLPFCFTLSVNGVINPSYVPEDAHAFRLLVTICSIALYFFLLNLLSELFKEKSFPKDMFNTARHCIFTYYILVTGIIILSSGILSLFGAGQSLSRGVIIWEMSLIFIVFLYAKLQIFASFCKVFPTFLYLCALDLIPTALLVASVTLT